MQQDVTTWPTLRVTFYPRVENINVRGLFRESWDNLVKFTIKDYLHKNMCNLGNTLSFIGAFQANNTLSSHKLYNPKSAYVKQRWNSSLVTFILHNDIMFVNSKICNLIDFFSDSTRLHFLKQDRYQYWFCNRMSIIIVGYMNTLS